MSRTVDATDEFHEKTLPESLKPLTRLPPDWADDGGDPPNDAALRAAAKVLERLSMDDLPKPDVSPSVEEGICISFWHRDRYAHIECFNTGEIVAAVMDEQRRHKTWTVRRTASDVLAAVSQLKKHLTEPAI